MFTTLYTYINSEGVKPMDAFFTSAFDPSGARKLDGAGFLGTGDFGRKAQQTPEKSGDNAKRSLLERIEYG